MKASTQVSLCEEFRRLSFSTWRLLKQAHGVGHKLLEDTITDINLLKIRSKCGSQIITRTFTRPEEGKSGGDWEWWLTGSSRKWLSFRVQAKVLNVSTETYEHIAYAPKGNFQVERLIRSSLSASPKRFPIYCLYNFWPSSACARGTLWKCRSYDPSAGSFGCTLMDALSAKPKILAAQRRLSEYLPIQIPWHCLVCCAGYGGLDLPERALNLWRNQIQLMQTRVPGDEDRVLYEQFSSVGVVDTPPEYVGALIHESEAIVDDPFLSRITVFQENEPVPERADVGFLTDYDK
jgi:Family of unknown function (DUF6615)